jgi:alkaline phosphatase
MTNFPVATLVLSLLLGACAPQFAPQGPAAVAGGDTPRNIILYIGDGVGTAYWTAALFDQDSLAVQRMRVMGLTDTRSADAHVTDSAAGATVYATGVRTYNGAIGVGVRCREMFAADSAAVMRDPAACDPLEGVFDVAHRRGIATGLVATSSLTHATPASFGAKVPYRRMQAEIATQLAAEPIDVLLGGGLGWFDGRLRADRRNLLTSLCSDAVCLSTREELAAYRPDDRRLVGLFAGDGMPVAAERHPTLPEMTRAALERLARAGDGFLLMVEGSQPDWRGHDNRPLDEVVDEMVEFDRAIGLGLDFARATPGTLVLVVSDHETGGLALVGRQGGVTARYSTGGHTGEMTPHFAYGAGAERFAGMLRNDEIGRILMAMVRQR